MQHDEGYIKFKSIWQKTEPFPQEEIQALNHWRQKLYEAKLIGAYPDGIGFGNVSQRIKGQTFYISGSTTGNFKVLNESHYSKVIDFDLPGNLVTCRGPIIASSESMSHAAIYQEVPAINAAFHVHDLALWEKVLHKIPTTHESAPYGCPEMSNEIIRLIRETDALDQKTFVMAGHREGLFSFGKTLDEAGNAILNLRSKFLG